MVMKIGNNVEPVQSDLVNRAAIGTRSVAPSSLEVPATASADAVKLSERSRALIAATGATAADEVIRPEKVAQVRQAIQEGNFVVSAQAVADKMINQAAELIEVMAMGNGR